MCTAATEQPFDLTAYAREHRYRLRNLHDGNPVPPARCMDKTGRSTGYWGADDRMDAIVGYNGYVAMDGDKLSVSLFYKSALGVNKAVRRLDAMGAEVGQVGDTEVGATVSVERIEDLLALIKVSRLRPPNSGAFRPGTGRVRDAESHERSPEVHSVHPERVGTV